METKKIAIDTRDDNNYEIYACVMNEEEYTKLIHYKIMFNIYKHKFEEVDFTNKLISDDVNIDTFDTNYLEELAKEGKFVDRGGYYENANDFYIDYDQLIHPEMIDISFAISRMYNDNYIAVVSGDITDMVTIITRGYGDMLEYSTDIDMFYFE